MNRIVTGCQHWERMTLIDSFKNIHQSLELQIELITKKYNWDIIDFRPFKSNRTVLYVLTGLLSFGILLELVQHQINSNRTYDLFDLISNCVGVIVGTVLARYLNIFKLN